MAEFILSAFSDEYAADFDEQIKGLQKNGIPLMEIRGVSGTNVGDLTETEAKEAAKKLNDGGIGISAIGSPIGKLKIRHSMDEHIEKLKRVISERLTGSDLDVEILEVWMDEVGTPGTTEHTALKSQAAISVESYGGDTTGVNIPFTLTQNGEVTPGKATLTAAFVPTFTANS